MTLPVETGVVEALAKTILGEKQAIDDIANNYIPDHAARHIADRCLAALARYEGSLGSSPNGDTHRAADGAVLADAERVLRQRFPGVFDPNDPLDLAEFPGLKNLATEHIAGLLLSIAKTRQQAAVSPDGVAV